MFGKGQKQEVRWRLAGGAVRLGEIPGCEFTKGIKVKQLNEGFLNVFQCVSNQQRKKKQLIFPDILHSIISSWCLRQRGRTGTVNFSGLVCEAACSFEQESCQGLQWEATIQLNCQLGDAKPRAESSEELHSWVDWERSPWSATTKKQNVLHRGSVFLI